LECYPHLERTVEVQGPFVVPDDGTLAVAGRRSFLSRYRVQLLDLTTSVAWVYVGAHVEPIERLALSSNGRVLATLDTTSRLGLWRMPNDRLRALFEQGFDAIRAMTSGRQSERGLLGWLQPPSPVRALTICPNGRTLAVAGDRIIRLWDVSSRTPRGTLAGHEDGIDALAFTPDGDLLLSGSMDGTVRVWNVEGATERAVLDWRIGEVNAIVISPDGRLAAAGGSHGAVIVWDLDDQ
jgi:WD40 repeat protein